MNILKPAILSIAILLTLLAFKQKDDPIKLLPKVFRNHFSHIPEHDYTFEDINNPVFQIRGLNESEEQKSYTVHVEPFYIMNTEVTNLLYQEFLKDLEQTNNSESLEVAAVDSAQWVTKHFYGEPYMETYHWHPAYDNYPIVNISHGGAQLFCKWYEEKLNTTSEELTFEVALPTREEWVAAAKGGLLISPYPWGGPYTSNAQGCILANFNAIGNESIHFNSETEEYEIVSVHGHSSAECTSPVDSHFANDFGLYNMAGNVAEMIAEPGIACGGSWLSTGFDIRCMSTLEYMDSQNDVGFRPIIKIKKSN